MCDGLKFESEQAGDPVLQPLLRFPKVWNPTLNALELGSATGLYEGNDHIAEAYTRPQSSRSPLAALLPLFPRHPQFPIAVGMNLLLMPGEPVLRRCQRHARPPSCPDKKWNIPQQEPPSCKQNLPQSDKRGSKPPGVDSGPGDHWFRAMVIAIPGWTSRSNSRLALGCSDFGGSSRVHRWVRSRNLLLDLDLSKRFVQTGIPPRALYIAITAV
jgi:hypothetical protein